MNTQDRRVWAVLACRARSTRLYGKPLQLIDNRPIVSHLIERLNTSRLIEGVVLAIADTAADGAFVEYAREENLRYVIGNEKDTLSRLIEGAHAVGADVVVRATTENPFTDHEHLDNLIEHHVTSGADLTFMHSLPSGTLAEVVNLEALECSHRLGEDRHRSELCTLYIRENPDAFKILRLDPPNAIARPDIRLTIDTPEDLLVARRLFEALSPPRGQLIAVEALVSYLDEHPELRSINQHLHKPRA